MIVVEVAPAFRSRHCPLRRRLWARVCHVVSAIRASRIHSSSSAERLVGRAVGLSTPAEVHPAAASGELVLMIGMIRKKITLSCTLHKSGNSARLHHAREVRTMRMKRSAAVIIAGMVSLGVSPALAHNATSPDGGSYVWNSTSTTFNVKDPKCDGHAAYGYVNNTTHRLDNGNGCGSIVTREYGTITAVRACTNIAFATDPCSSWQ